MTILSFTPGTWYRDDISFTPGTSTSGYSINIIWFNSGVARMWLNVLVTCQPQPSAPLPLFLRKKVRRHSVYVPCVCRAEHWVILPNQVQFYSTKCKFTKLNISLIELSICGRAKRPICSAANVFQGKSCIPQMGSRSRAY